MSHMYRRAWRVGLKTTYYLRTLGASSIEKSTVARVSSIGAEAVPVTVPTEAEIQACSIEAMRNGQECEACQ